MIYSNGASRAVVIFKCKCGNNVIHPPCYAIDGRIQSCGCLSRKPNTRNKKYQYVSDKLRRVYYSMISRCYNPNDTGYIWYGACGVRVCDEWRSNPQAFFDWAIKSGYKEGLCLDKDIKGQGKLYSPDNCIWVTHGENNRKRRKKGTVTKNNILIQQNPAA